MSFFKFLLFSSLNWDFVTNKLKNIKSLKKKMINQTNIKTHKNKIKFLNNNWNESFA